jgi:hypothetical protein
MSWKNPNSQLPKERRYPPLGNPPFKARTKIRPWEV